MSKVQMLRAVVEQRLTAAAEEIFGLFERTIAEYEEELGRSKEENERQRRRLDAVFSPQLRLHRADVQQLLVVKKEVPSEQQEWSSSVDQEDPEPPHIKEEQEDIWTSQEGEQLQGLDDVETKFTFTLVPVKSEDKDEAKPQSSQLHHRPEAARNCDSDTNPEPETVSETGDSSEPETDKSFSRSECGNGFTTKGNLKRHMRSHTGEKPLSCSVCSNALCLSGHLNRHIEIHTGPKHFSCSVCSKTFSEIGSLKTHIRVHTGEKPFSCTVCSKAFRQSGSLKEHMRIHTGEKPFSCSVCSKVFRKTGHLKRHMRIHTGEKSFSCSVCSKAFSESGHLKKHMIIHTGEKHFSCSVCSKAFRQSGHLKKHMIIHTGEKPFSCSVCSKVFRITGNLKRHMRIHTGEKPFSCSVCSKVFSESGHLKTHMRSHRERNLSETPASSTTEQRQTDAGGEDCGGPEAALNSDPDTHPEPDTVDKTGDSSEPETDDSDDWKDTRD